MLSASGHKQQFRVGDKLAVRHGFVRCIKAEDVRSIAGTCPLDVHGESAEDGGLQQLLPK
jgi:hypothetical protein